MAHDIWQHRPLRIGGLPSGSPGDLRDGSIHNPAVRPPTAFLRFGLARGEGVETSRPASIAIDVALLAGLFALVAGVVGLAQRWNAPIREAAAINLDPRALPGYTLLSLSRGLAAYLLSLVFTLVYGTVAAHSRRAERIMIPLLDIGQGIPVLGFLPGLVLGLVALFPNTNVGLELACILMIFTGQVWNMVFSFYGSLRSVPAELKEVARIHRFSWWKGFRTVEVSSAVIGLVWNSMMSMAGGWFFLTVTEAFTLGDRDFRLPGVGSYMSVAIEKGDKSAMAWAIVAMTVMILAVDQLLWKPLVAWSQRFRQDEISSGDPPRSWVLDLLRQSWIARRLRQARRGAVETVAIPPTSPAPAPVPAAAPGPSAGGQVVLRALAWAVGIGAAGATVWVLCAWWRSSSRFRRTSGSFLPRRSARHSCGWRVRWRSEPSGAFPPAS